MPEVYFDGKWVPICGQYFWNNNIGANLFCQEFGFESGTLKNTHLTLPNDGLNIGKCEQRDAWLQCSGNCNNLQIGGFCGAGKCTKGSKSGILIDCSGVGKYEHVIWFEKSRPSWHRIGHFDLAVAVNKVNISSPLDRGDGKLKCS